MPNHLNHKAFGNVLNWSIKPYTCKSGVSYLWTNLKAAAPFVCFVCGSVSSNQQRRQMAISLTHFNIYQQNRIQIYSLEEEDDWLFVTTETLHAPHFCINKMYFL